MTIKSLAWAGYAHTYLYMFANFRGFIFYNFPTISIFLPFSVKYSALIFCIFAYFSGISEWNEGDKEMLACSVKKKKFQ